jgi:hypothetical protein
MKINGEPVELVKDFGELRSGMIVWLTACNWCPGRMHRSMLGRSYSGLARYPLNDHIETEGFYMLPGPPCDEGSGVLVTYRDVVGTRVYRVVDEQFDKEQRSAKSAEPKTKTRAKADQGQR